MEYFLLNVKRYSSVQCSTAQHSTAQQSATTAQDSSVQYSTVHASYAMLSSGRSWNIPQVTWVFLRIQRKCVYKEKSSHEWDISRYTTRKHYITNLSRATLTHLSFLHRFRWKSRLKLGFSSSIFKLFTLNPLRLSRWQSCFTFGGKIWRPEERWNFFRECDPLHTAEYAIAF